MKAHPLLGFIIPSRDVKWLCGIYVRNAENKFLNHILVMRKRKKKWKRKLSAKRRKAEDMLANILAKVNTKKDLGRNLY